MGGYIPRGLLGRGVVAVADAVGHVKVGDVELVQLGREVHEGLARCMEVGVEVYDFMVQNKIVIN